MHQRTRSTAANPLGRDADRSRTRLPTAFALACLLAAICGVLVGRAVWDDGSRAVQETARHRHSTTATTTAGTGDVAATRNGTQPPTVAPATWHGSGVLCAIALAAGALVFVRQRTVDAHSAQAWETPAARPGSRR
ncbi:hypothetical protein [Streptomyces vinaceus]|uniref:hypothetical protein n=1 Tax=Streptomyces vinaceus TaxID=1960 RepID=UPI00381E1CB8